MSDHGILRVLLASAVVGLTPISVSGQTTSVAQQFTLRDYVDRFAQLTDEATPALADLMLSTHRAGRRPELTRMAGPLLTLLGRSGLERIESQERAHFGVDTEHFVGECAVMDWVADESLQWSMHVEVTYWDPNRAASTEIYEMITAGRVSMDDYDPEKYVEICSNLLSNVLVRLGFDGG